jgi:predicted dienelactone hydrolase
MRIVVPALALAFLLASPAPAQDVLTLTRADGQTLRIKPYPATGACRGIAILSHGAGGSEEGLAYLAQAMAEDGYLAVAIGHQESGRQALRQRVRGAGIRGGLTDLVSDSAAYRGRLMDVAAARQWASVRCTGKESVLLGHSMGAATVMIEAGARNNFGVTGADAFDAYVALSPQGAGLMFPANAWSHLQKPVLSITGTRDTELGGASWETRKEPFANMPPGCKWLAVIDRATHMDLGGRGATPRVQSLAVQTVRAFLRGARSGRCAPPAVAKGLEMQGK